MTVYKQIPGYEGLYEAGEDGTIWSCEGKTTFSKLSDGKIRKRVWKRRKLKPKLRKRPRSTHYDYRVDLWKNRTHKTLFVARLVAMTFVPNKDHKPCINHIDGNTFNNRPDNLEWCTYAENTEHAFRTGLRKDNKLVKLVSSKNGFTNEFYSMAQASRWLGFNHGYISGLLSKGITSVGEYQIIKLGDDKMSDRAQRVFDALMEYDADNGIGYPIRSIIEFFDDENITPIGEDYEELTVEEEKQVINGFLESAY